MTHLSDSGLVARKQELQEKIEEIEVKLHDLRERLRSQEQSAQHDAIDHLEDYLGEVDNKYANLRDFWQVIREEWRELVSRSDDRDKEK